ncbi:MAG: hypothetical protein RI897_817 [Verrucomicrobiota bacterium]|jgi:hypothetical protein
MESERTQSVWKVLGVVLLLLVSGVLVYRSFLSGAGGGERAFFYDLSEGELFVASRELIPPIRGVNDEVEDGVRAVVISTNGDVRDKSSWVVSYLEMYTPELKGQMERARETGVAPEMGRGMAQAHRLVRRVEGGEWYSMNTAEAEFIIGGWLTAGPGGGPAVVCVP